MFPHRALWFVALPILLLTPRSVFSQTCYVELHIYSDPPGARVYGSNGSDWGLTSLGRPVKGEAHVGEGGRYTVHLLLKKHGYKATNHNVTIKYEDDDCYEDIDEAKQHPRKITVVLDD